MQYLSYVFKNVFTNNNNLFFLYNVCLLHTTMSWKERYVRKYTKYLKRYDLKGGISSIVVQ